MRWVTGTTSAGGQISTLTTMDGVKVVEFHARSGNTGSVVVGGDSGTSTTNGREIAPGGDHTVNFEEGSVKFSTFYVAFVNAGDLLDWSVVLNP